MRTRRRTRRFRERLTAVLAVVGAATLMTGFVVVGTTGTAQADNEDNTNSAAYWEGQGYGTCEKPAFTSESDPYLMPTAPTGKTWSLLVVKAGSTGASVTNENTLYHNPVAGQSYRHAEKNSISHVIQCHKPSTQPKVISLQLTYMVDCDLTKNTWRVRNETGQTVETTWQVYGGGASDEHLATPGDTFFTTAYGSQTVKLNWGDGQTIAFGETVKASGPDATNCEPKEVSLKLTYIVDCDLTKNTWRVRNETGQTVQTTWQVYGGTATGSHSATPGDTYFDTAYGPQTVKLTWGDGQTIAYGETVKASGPDATNCEPKKVVVTPEGEPLFKDPCGTKFDKTIVPDDTELVDWERTYEGSTVTVTAQLQPNLPAHYVLAEGDWTWTYTFTDEPCPGLELSFVPDCVATHQWKVTSTFDTAVTAWYGLGKSVVVPANGTATFTTDSAKDYAWIFWGGKGTGIWPGFEKEHAGADRTDCNYTPPPQPVLIPVTPEITYTDPCGTADDTVDGVTKTGYTFVVDQAAGTVTFTAVPGYYISGPTTLSAPWTDVPCPLEATPVNPTAVQSDECEVEGSYTIPDTPGVQYLIDGEPVEPGTYDGPIAETVTAEAVGNTVLTIEDWSFDLVVTPASKCEVAPAEVEDVCTNIAGVQEEVPEGYSLVEGLCVADEVAPTEDVAPAPVVGPAAVPTAVDAGLAGPMDAGSGPGSPVGLALISAGLMMLLAAGALQTGRRERGTHEI